MSDDARDGGAAAVTSQQMFSAADRISEPSDRRLWLALAELQQAMEEWRARLSEKEEPLP